MSGVTLYGAIGNCLKTPSVFTVDQGTTIVGFTRFIETLVQQKIQIDSRPYLILDNHSAHRSKKLTELLTANFKVLWMPPYSCEFNSIERLWAYIKRSFK